MSGSLVVGPAWIGDMVMAHCLVQLIHTSAPYEPLVMLAPPATAAVAGRMAEISEVRTLETAHGEFGLGKRFRLGRALALEKFERSFVLPNSWKSALVPFFAGIPKRTGWLGEARYGLLNDTAAVPAERLPLMIERFMGLLNLDDPLVRPYPQPTLVVDVQQQEALKASHQLKDGAVALCPGAEFGQAKRWPAEHFIDVATQVVKQERQVWLLGGPADRAVCEQIAAEVPDADRWLRNLAGETSLTQVIDILATASAVVCNDSGLMHVACAVGTPVIALYGSTSPGFTPPLHPDAQALTLVDLDGGANKLDCQPCFERLCRYGHGDCLGLLTPRFVVQRLEQLGLLAGLEVS